MSEAVSASLHVPEPPARPGHKSDFSYLKFSQAGEIAQPPHDVAPGDIRDMAYLLIRVLDDDGAAKGPGLRPSTPARCAAGCERCRRPALMTPE